MTARMVYDGREIGGIMTRYEIRAGKYAPCELVSIVVKNGWEYTNFIADGTHTFCATIKARLEADS